jgi:hypothetical protein
LKQQIFFIFFLFITNADVSGQMITGVWHGRINRQKAEVKIIQKGDSLTGTSYYYESTSNYRRYSIKGYFDQLTNTTVWWDDKLLEEKSGRFSITSPGKIPLLSQADFNCPGGGKMMLDGTVSKKDEVFNEEGEVHLNKSGISEFEDEWDFVIDNYTVGGNDPELIDSIASLSQRKPVEVKPEIIIEPVKEVVVQKPVPVAQPEPKHEIVIKKEEKVIEQPLPIQPTIEKRFTERKKVFIKEIPVSGDSIELRFYDNAEIDGDSISLFLNGKVLKENIGLKASPYIIKLSVTELLETNELVMVAENLGTIPPNTSYMVAIINNERYDAYLASSEGSSAMIRLKKNK